MSDRFLTHLLIKALGDLVGALVLCDLLTEDKDVLVALHLLHEGGVEGLAHGHLGGHGAGAVDAEHVAGGGVGEHLVGVSGCCFLRGDSANEETANCERELNERCGAIRLCFAVPSLLTSWLLFNIQTLNRSN